MEIIKWIATNVFGIPAFLLGFIVLLGLLLQKKTVNQVISGTCKAIIGFLIINAGAGVIVNALTVFEPMWSEVFGIKASSFSQFIGQKEFNTQFGSAVTLAMTLGFLINVLLARFTKFKYIYLTGHMMFWTTTIFAGIVIHTAGTDVPYWKLVAFLSIIMGLYWTFQPALIQPFLRKIIGSDSFALGHTSASVSLLGAIAGKYLGNKDNDAEKVNLPKKIEFLRDSNVITSLTMGVLFVIGAIVLLLKNTEGAQTLIAKAGDQNFVIYAIIQSFTFAAGIAVVLFGVRLFVGEMVPAFNGIATKLVRGAIPALDCPLVYPYSPNSVILGFIGAFIGIILWLVVLGQGIGYVFIPTMIVLFFHGATAGVFGNSTGGVRGALLGGFITTTVVAWGQFLMVNFFITSTIPDTAMWAADSDMFILGPIIKLLAQLIF